MVHARMARNRGVKGYCIAGCLIEERNVNLILTVISSKDVRTVMQVGMGNLNVQN